MHVLWSKTVSRNVRKATTGDVEVGAEVGQGFVADMVV